jgi:branched-chain amino acid transport system ATP-binding protein
VLEIKNLEVRYGAVPAVRDLTLRLGKGELVGLIGPNGAGKSTTLHAVSGLLAAHAGDVTLDGRSLRGRTPEAIARSGIALVPEGRRIFADFSVEENLKLGLAARREGGGRGALEEAYEVFPRLREFR